MEHLKMHSLNKIDENIAKIATLFPNCVTEAKDDNGEIIHKIDFDMLKQELSSTFVDGREERYQFTWPDKRQAILTANAPINKTLRPCREESVNFDNTQNLYIEGDNLEVLKLLQETYLGKIKMIYIDPPYNTGNDFVYNDNFRTKNLEFREKSGNFDEEGKQLVDNYTRNTESNGRFHTDWLNMMYPRLNLARDLLSDDGVIFISIDEHESHNLRKICDEIFGNNFIGEVIRKTKSMTADNGNGFNLQHEVLVIYAKNKSSVYLKGEEKNFSNYSNPDNDPNGEWCTADPSARSGGVSTSFGIENPYTHRVDYPPKGRYWAFSKETLNSYIESGRLKFKEEYGENERGFIFKRYRNSMSITTEPVNSLFSAENDYMNQTATIEIKNLFNDNYFSYPKPVNFIKKLVQYTNAGIILDFFSGSATTAHAVMQLNAEDGGNRKFIMVQLPELCDEKSEAYKAGYKNICEIGKERIRRAGKQLLKTTIQTGGGMENSLFENSLTTSAETPLGVSNPCDTKKLDIGFRVLKCDTSNMEDVYYSPDHLDKQDLFKNNIKNDRTAEDLLFQVMLDLGIMLSSKIETKKIDGKTVFYVEENYLVACFDDNVDEKTITEIAKEKPYYFVMRDSSMANDSVATNFEQIFKTYLGENYNPDNIKII
ncbi:site-specific DNA-methyltransferase [uncultured Treponema sp.]|uniref:site-specific DNA-methyltransferase n=1 Tax=uncultured Treponema sp. TaxID=162155 RepID=UPI0015A91F26|nr:site-specific DNA-methyltransferase [uncultured Treponema sp.]